MTATEITMREFEHAEQHAQPVRALSDALAAVEETNRQLARLIADPLWLYGASWNEQDGGGRKR